MTSKSATRTAPRRATPRCVSGRPPARATPKWAGYTYTTASSSSNRRSAAQTIPAPPSASAFRVVHDHVTSVFRHDDLAAALAATELTDADLVD